MIQPPKEMFKEKTQQANLQPIQSVFSAESKYKRVCGEVIQPKECADNHTSVV